MKEKPTSHYFNYSLLWDFLGNVPPEDYLSAQHSLLLPTSPGSFISPLDHLVKVVSMLGQTTTSKGKGFDTKDMVLPGNSGG